MTDEARQEGVRRALHLATGLVGVAAAQLPRRSAAAVFVACAVLAILLDLARARVPAVQGAVDRVIGPVYRPSERRAVSGGTLLAVGYALAWLLAPAAAAGPAVAVTAVADPAAAFAGRRWGRVPGRKSLAGTLAAALAAFAVLLAWRVIPTASAWRPSLVVAAVAAAVAALAERAPWRGADNLTVPLAAAATLALLA